ncbi:MAG: hypothetical protein IJ454_03350, partial [Clostridia bacterium]|nr:hypothetical protein [Clostridia bacterium]
LLDTTKVIQIAGPAAIGDFVISADVDKTDIDAANETKVMLWNATDGKLTPLSQTVSIPLSE